MCQLRFTLYKVTGWLASLDVCKPYTSRISSHQIESCDAKSVPFDHSHSRQPGWTKRGRGKSMNDLVVKKSGLLPTKQKYARIRIFTQKNTNPLLRPVTRYGERRRQRTETKSCPNRTALPQWTSGTFLLPVLNLFTHQSADSPGPAQCRYFSMTLPRRGTNTGTWFEKCCFLDFSWQLVTAKDLQGCHHSLGICCALSLDVWCCILQFPRSTTSSTHGVSWPGHS